MSLTALAWPGPARPAMHEPTRKRIRLRPAARRLGCQSSYLSEVSRNGILTREGVTVMRDPDDPRVVFFYEDEIIQWWKARHPDWVDPEQTS